MSKMPKAEILIKVYILLLFLSLCEGWRALRMETIRQAQQEENEKVARVHRRRAVINTRYKYNKCWGRQREDYNKTIYEHLAGNRLFYFEVKLSRAPRCVVVSVYVHPKDFLKPARYLIQLCLGMMTLIWKKAINVRFILEFSMTVPATNKMFIIAAVLSGSA